MTSTFPTSRSNSHNLRYSIKQLQHKKEALINLEAALKRRINEFRELCLKEGELTGHLPADYPLQPREPIPQVRRRITRSNGNIPNEFQSSLASSNSGNIMPAPLSTIRLIKKNGQVTPNFALPGTLQDVHHLPLSSHSSIAGSLHHIENLKHDMPLHGRSNSESVTNGCRAMQSHISVLPKQPISIHENNLRKSNLKNSEQQPVRPVRGVQVSNRKESGMNHIQQYIEKQGSESSINGLYTDGKYIEKKTTVKTLAETVKDVKHLSEELKNFQPFYEETKPFQMSDFYKYSAKHRQKSNLSERPESIDNVYIDNKSKTTRQLQDEIARMKDPLKFASCDDQIQASQKLIEKSDQILMRATARAIAVNPSLAEKLNSIAFNHNDNHG